MKSIFSILLFFLYSLTCSADTYTFIGNGGWSVSTNWENDLIAPMTISASDTVILNGDCLIDANVINSGLIEINGTITLNGYEFTNVNKIENIGDIIIDSGEWLEAGDSLINYGNITVTSLMTVYQGFTNHGLVTVDGTLDKLGFRLDNYGIIDVLEGGLLDINQTGSLPEYRFFNHLGSELNIDGTVETNSYILTFLEGSEFNISSTGLLINNATIDNFGTWNNYGTIQCGEFYYIQNKNSGVINNFNKMYCGALIQEGIVNNNNYIEIAFLLDLDSVLVNNDTLILHESVFPFHIISQNGILENNATVNNFHLINISGQINNEIQGTFENKINGSTQINPNGVLENNGMYIEVTPTINAGVITGDGIHNGDITNNSTGIVAPGINVGLYSINGNINNNGTVKLEIEGTLQGVSYDYLLLNPGVADLQGTLDVILQNGYSPQLGDEYIIIEYDSFSNFFTQLNLPNLINLEWEVIYETNQVKLKVVQAGTSATKQVEICGQLYITSQFSSVVLTSPTGQCYKLSVDSNGELNTVQIPCPN